VQDWSIPLGVATAAFLAALVWRVRPLVGGAARGKAGREAVRAAHARVEAAKTADERAEALCDAAGLVGAGSAKGLYLRAMREAPASAAIVERAAVSLARRPRALEALLWRRLGATPWASSRDATVAALDVLVRLYEGPLRNAVRAKTMANARQALAPDRPRDASETASTTS
jgi:hypothetical protein